VVSRFFGLNIAENN